MRSGGRSVELARRVARCPRDHRNRPDGGSRARGYTKAARSALVKSAPVHGSGKAQLLGERVGEQVTEVERGGVGATTLAIGEHALTREQDLLAVDRDRLDLVEHEQSVISGTAAAPRPTWVTRSASIQVLQDISGSWSSIG
jgi:hypothetical protein